METWDKWAGMWYRVGKHWQVTRGLSGFERLGVRERDERER